VGHPQRILFWLWLEIGTRHVYRAVQSLQRDTTVRRGAKPWIVRVPDSEDVGVFVTIGLFQEVEVRPNRRGKSRGRKPPQRDLAQRFLGATYLVQ
jgi:hypothetical protein